MADARDHLAVTGGEDPMAADRRTLIIAGVAMVALILVGVVTSAVFTGSACDAIAPSPVDAGSAGTDVPGVLADAFPDASDTELEAMADDLTTLADDLGPITGIAQTPAATDLAVTDAGLAALGSQVTLLDDTGSQVRAAVELDEGVPVGSGDALYSLMIENPITGQVDALQPLDTAVTSDPDALLEGQTCQDTATVGTPLAFHLDAGGGELLLLRIDEDGSDPDIQLRDPVAGQVWATRLQLDTAPAGVLGERLTGGLGEDVVVLGAWTDPDAPERDDPRMDEIVDVEAVTALARDSGEPRWQLDRDDLRDVLAADVPTAIEVRTVGDEIAVLAAVPEASEQGSVGPTEVIGVAVDDGEVLWHHTLDPETGPTLGDVVTDGERAWVGAVDDAAGMSAIGSLDRDDGEAFPVTTDGGVTSLAPHGDVVVAVGPGTVVLLEPDGSHVASMVLDGRAALHHDQGVTLLFGASDGEDDAVAVTFAD